VLSFGKGAKVQFLRLDLAHEDAKLAARSFHLSDIVPYFEQEGQLFESRGFSNGERHWYEASSWKCSATSQCSHSSSPSIEQ